MLRFGPNDGPLVIAALPLFEEANRTRAFMVAILHGLAACGVGGLLPDFPGTGESDVATADASLFAMREAFEDLADRVDAHRRIYGVAIRSGVLLDGFALLFGRWQLTPQTGEELLRELWRTSQAQPDVTPRAYDSTAMIGGEGEHMEIAGNLLSRDRMLGGLAGALPYTEAEGVPLRLARLASDPRPADVHLPGPPLWRRSEPSNNVGLVQAAVADIADWIARCES